MEAENNNNNIVFGAGRPATGGDPPGSLARFARSFTFCTTS